MIDNLTVMLKSLIQKNRSYRRFYEKKKIGLKILKSFIELARLSASSANLQPLKYFLSCTHETNEKTFTCLKWAGYLKDWQGPLKGERPSAYIVILGDTNISKGFGYDAGIAAQSILLGAVEKGLGGCILGSIEREKLRELLKIPQHLEILLVAALGKPKEKVVIEPLKKNGDIRYWRDKKDVHHVPKRALKDIIIN
ncbi:MAG: nitroreductase family protein [Candidatus Roizmanbacteria bacterium]|nr:nitroreductase family protein [Candidatus Roizmanbacteria bacterium]